MADVIRLSDRSLQVPRRPKADEGSAEIMLFTGVRYERRDTSTTPTDKRPLTGGAKKR